MTVTPPYFLVLGQTNITFLGASDLDTLTMTIMRFRQEKKFDVLFLSQLQ